MSYLEFQGWETRIDPVFEPRNNAGVRDLDVRPHPLESYDALTRTADEPDE